VYESQKNCPEIDEMICYFSNQLDEDKKSGIEEHFYSCESCTKTAREVSYYFSRQRIIKARPLLGKAWEKFGDAVEAKAAGESKSMKIREVVTRNGKYRVALRPLESNPAIALLEVEVLDPSVTGRLKITSISKYCEVIDIDENRLACAVVTSSIDLERIIINKHEL